MKKLVTAVIIITSSRLFALPLVEIKSIANQNPVLSGYTQLAAERIQRTIQHFSLMELNDEEVSGVSSDITFSISIYIAENSYNALIEITGKNPDLARIYGNIRIRTRYIENIPVLAAREIIRLHENIPVIIEILPGEKSGFYSASIGSSTPFWRNYLAEANNAEITGFSSFSSLLFSEKEILNKKVILKNRIKTDGYVAETELELRKNIFKIHRINRKAPEEYTEHKFIEGLAITNPLGNILGPGFGSYYSMKNLGIEKPDYSYINIFTTFTAAVVQVLYVPYKNDFEFNYKFNESGGYTKEDDYLQMYLLAALPFTFSASYLDNLALNCRKQNLLPPFYMHQDSAAAGISFFLPGGGYFYKGYRSAGLLMYGTQFAYGAYYFSNFSETSRNVNYAFGFLALRLIDVAGAWFIPDNYRFYHDQINEKDTVSLFTNLEIMPDKSPAYYTGLTLTF